VSPATAVAAGAALLGAVLWPVRQNWRPRRQRRDGFPLSYYPMFSAERMRTGTVVHLVGVDAHGETRWLHYSHAGTGGLNQVRRQLRCEVKAGRAERVASTVAAAVARRGGAATRGVREVRVVSGTYNYAEFFAGRVVAEREVVHATAAVVSRS